jgi:DNA polymerase elongation subunit (family B)
LQYVATAALGMGKIPYNGTLQDLYESDFEQYVYYNAIDSVLVKLIDEKISTMSTYLKLGNITKVEANRAFSPIAMAESVMTRVFHDRNRVFPTIKNRNINKTAYEGAFVFPPVKGIYDWVASFDFASLYPTIMRQWNMSPESFLGKESKKPELENITYSSSGAYFDDTEDSVFRTVLADFYGQRKSAKKKMFVVNDDIEKLKELKKNLQKI